MKQKKEKIGGMALFNGLMLRNKKREVVSKIYDENKISVEITNISNTRDEDKFTIYDIPIIRGIISMKNMITSSVPYVLNSAQNVLDKNSKEKINIDKFEIITAYIISISLVLILVAAIPNFISTFIDMRIRNISQAIMQTASFVIYLLILSKFSNLKTLFEYHGAEHKVANAYEKLDIKDITVENVKKESRFHIRCGGNFVVYLFLLIIFITLIIPSNNLIFKTIIQVLLLPFLAGFSYELVMYTAYLPSFLKFLAYPAMSIQLITTKEPTDDKIELAIYTLFGCLNGNKKISLKSCLDCYLQKNKKLKDKFEINDALLIVSDMKNMTKDEIFLKLDDIMLEYSEQINLIKMLNMIYKNNMPLAYILGHVNFYNEKYIVNNKVLIPRVDSEILVDNAIKYIEKEKFNTLLDLCTGSGCLGISIANNSSIKSVTLLDVSKEALKIAQKNISLNNANDKCKTLLSDLFLAFNNTNIKYDIIISNPPYIKSKDLVKLDDSVKKEPLIALDGGEDGMMFYEKILSNASNYLSDNGIIMFEIGYDQLNDIKKLLNKYKNYKLIDNIKDYGGNDRVVICRFQKI